MMPSVKCEIYCGNIIFFRQNVKRFYRQQYNAELFYLRYKAMRLPIVCVEDL